MVDFFLPRASVLRKLLALSTSPSESLPAVGDWGEEPRCDAMLKHFDFLE